MSEDSSFLKYRKPFNENAAIKVGKPHSLNSLSKVMHNLTYD